MNSQDRERYRAHIILRIWYLLVAIATGSIFIFDGIGILLISALIAGVVTLAGFMLRLVVDLSKVRREELPDFVYKYDEITRNLLGYYFWGLFLGLGISLLITKLPF